MADDLLPEGWTIERIQTSVYLQHPGIDGLAPSYAIGHGSTLEVAMTEAIAIARQNDEYHRQLLRNQSQRRVPRFESATLEDLEKLL